MSDTTLLGWIAQHQEILTWLGGGITTAAGGAWVVVRYLLDRDPDTSASNKSSRKPAPGSVASAGTGIAAARDVQISGNVSIQQTHIPKAAIVLAVVGLLLLGYAAFNSGSRVNVTNGSYVGGSVSNSQIRVTPSN